MEKHHDRYLRKTLEKDTASHAVYPAEQGRRILWGRSGELFGCLLVAFWSPFGCLLGALGTSLGDFASILAALGTALETFVGLWSGNGFNL